MLLLRLSRIGVGILNLVLLPSALSKTIHLHWNITWVNASPDGFERPVIGINGQWPCPRVDVSLGDRLIVDLYNDLGSQSTGIHWHGLFQHMSPEMDGTSDVTQCPVAPGQRIRYDFVVGISPGPQLLNLNSHVPLGQSNRDLLVSFP